MDLPLYKRKRQVELVPPGRVNSDQRFRINLIEFSWGFDENTVNWCNINLTTFLGGPVILLKRITSEIRPVGNLGKFVTVRGVILT